MIVDKILFLSTAVIKNERKEILLIKRSKLNKAYKNYWQLPEGKIELNESPIDALIREIKEELNCKVIKHELTKIIYTNGLILKTHYLLIRTIFEVEIGGNIKLSNEHLNYRYLSISEALKLKSILGTKEIIKTLKI